MYGLPISHTKNISNPKVIYEEPHGQYYGGWYSVSTKTICIVHNTCIKQEAAVLAHEYRHHVQHETGIYDLRKNIISPNQPNKTYEEMIRWYFTSSAKEFDALMFEYTYAKSELNDWWLNHLVTTNEYEKRLMGIMA